MLVINRLTEPGGIRRVYIRIDMIHIILVDGREYIYRLEKKDATTKVLTKNGAGVV